MRQLRFWLLLLLPALARAAPCTDALPECGEWLALGAGPARVWLYRTHALHHRDERITHALVVIHGQGRDAAGTFRTAAAAGFLAKALPHTLIVAPRIASNNGRSCRDELARDEANWGCAGPASWRSGGFAEGTDTLTAFDIADTLLPLLADRANFPRLRSITLAGHSAGGQYVTRYQMLNRLHDDLGVPINYVVANPSSYTYPESRRPTAAALPPDAAAAPPGYVTPPSEGQPAFRAFADARNCTTYDDWPYGLRQRVGYGARLRDDAIRRQLAARPALYLLGELDILPLYGFDASCAAMAQGPTRLARGYAFARLVNETLGARHRIERVPACGHSARCMFTAEAGLRALFPPSGPTH
jgi:hypothetical protein